MMVLAVKGIATDVAGRDNMEYTVHDVIKAEHNLEPIVCLYCGSNEVTFHQYVCNGDAYCADCGKWQLTGEQ
jgi:hypothetical protein